MKIPLRECLKLRNFVLKTFIFNFKNNIEKLKASKNYIEIRKFGKIRALNIYIGLRDFLTWD